ncbi:MAG: sensor histidine kinase [Mobilitalea sp.]
MKIISEVIQYSIYGLEAFLWWRLTNGVLNMKYNKKYHIEAAILMFLIMVFKQYLIKVTGVDGLQVIGSVFLMGYTFVAAFLLFRNSFVEKLIWWGVFYLGLSIMELVAVVLISLITNKSLQELSESDEMGLGVIILSKLITILLFELIIRKRKHKLVIGFTYFKELALVIGFNIVLLLGIVFVFSNTNFIETNINNIILILFVIVILITVFTIALIFQIERKSQEEMANKLKLQQIELELKLNDDMVSITDKLRKLRHDMNNHIGLIKTLLKTEKLGELREYIDQIYEDVEIANEMVITENKTLSVLLNSKKNKAKDKNIDFQSMIAMKEIKMQNKDICALLGNILDNAIEAAEKVDVNRYIQLTMQNTDLGCIIKCENSLCVKPIMRRGKFITLKEDTFIHGIGTENIKDIVAKYKGEVSFDYDEDSFNVRVFMPV